MQPPKRMLEASQDASGKWHVAINFSSLDLIQTCLRKAHYALDRKLVAAEESEALAFGSAVHKALEFWYALPPSERELPPKLAEQASLYAVGVGLEESSENAALEAIRRFCLARWDVLHALDPADKRALGNGVKILQAYFKLYASDRFTVLREPSGRPYIERQFEHEIFNSEQLTIRYHGTIDVVLQNQDTGLVLVADHKTTHALGKEFYQRCKPNFQYCGYVWGAREALGLQTNLFLVNGIQVAKTKQEFARQTVEYEESDFEELKNAVWENSVRYINAKKNSLWPMSTPNPCSNYGGCGFLKACEVPQSIRENVIKSNWNLKQQ